MKNSGHNAKGTHVSFSLAAKKIRQRFVDHWNIDDPAGLVLLDELCACFDRLQHAKRLLRARGSTVNDRFDQVKVSPWFLAVRDETATLIRLSKALNLEVEGQDNRPGRPDGFQPEIHL